MLKADFVILFVIFAIANLCVVESAPRCIITKKLATQIQFELADTLNESKIRNVKVSDKCDEMINKIIHFSSRIRNNLRLDKSFTTRKNKKLQEFQENDEVKNFNFTLNGVRNQLKTVYQKTYESLITSLDEFEQNVEESLADQLPIRMKIDLYSLIVSHNEIDLDVNHSDNCEINSSNLEKMFEIFNEIRVLTHVPVSDDCRDLTSELINVRGIVAIAKIHEKNMLSLLDRRLNTEMELIKNITNFIKNDRKDYENLRGEFSASEKFLIEVKRDVDNWKEFLSIQACKTINSLILTSNNLNILNDAISECKDESNNVSPLRRALSEIYKCDKTKLPKIHNFIKKYSGSDGNQYRTHVSWLLSEMKKCDQTTNLVLLKMSLSNKQDFAEEIADIHKQISEKVRANDLNVINDIEAVKENLDFHEIVVNCFDKNTSNLKVTRKFIEKYSTPDLFLENDLLEEFYSVLNIPLEDQLRMGFWLKTRLEQVSQIYRDKLELLKDRKLPHLVNTLCFKIFTLTSKNDKRRRLLTPGTTDKQVQSLTSKGFENKDGFFLSFYDSANPLGELCIVKGGGLAFADSSQNPNCLWKVNFVQDRQCTTCVTIIDIYRKVYLSSEYFKVCVESNLWGNCVKNQYFNQAMSMEHESYAEQLQIN